MGAIATGGVRVLNDDVVSLYKVPGTLIDEVARQEEVELRRRERAYRDGGPPIPLAGRTVLLIDVGWPQALP
jgi:predicted phosphoribosyltransferase